MKRLISLIVAFAICAMLCVFPCGIALADDSSDEGTLLAFPGAEGGGKYTKGARAALDEDGGEISVYHVTNLNSSGTGSLADAVSSSNRIIVFDVGGTIDMYGKTLTISANNLTILGQTAPGDGITITNGDLLLKSGVEQVIIRYLRVRPTDEMLDEPDGIGGRWNNHIIIDHCSTSWSVDELLTLYAGSSETDTPGSNLTVQNTLASESLRMSNHIKGAHGYGAIFGATNSTWYRNLLAHHDSRSPRLDRELQKTDIRNNVIYNWGQTNSAYGGEGDSYNGDNHNGTYVNYANNYYKYGPATKSSLRSRIFQITVSGTQQFYFDGNYVWDNTDVTSDNSQGVSGGSSSTLISTEIDMGDYAIDDDTLLTAEEAYDSVLDDVGATLPKRDAIDARIIADVENQTGRIINSADEVGGVIETDETTETFTIPDTWLSTNGYSSMSETDIITDETSEWYGYTVIEAYVNDWTAEQSETAPTNPSITVTSPAIQDMNSLGTNNEWAVITEGETLSYQATATASTSDTTITEFEIYDGSTLLKSCDITSGSSVSINESLSLTAGTHYITSRAYNDNGEATQSPTSIVYVKGDSTSITSSGYTHTQIGSTAFGTSGGSWVDDDGVYTIMGSGKLVAPGGDGYTINDVSSDSCDFMYKAIEGDFDIYVKMDQIPKYENFVVAGLMVREDFSPTGRMAFLADGWLKYGENCEIIHRDTANDTSTVTYFNNSSGTAVQNGSSYDTSDEAYSMPSYMRIQRSDDTLTFSVSDSGTDWTDNARQPMSITYSDLADTLYVGLAVDSAQGTPMKEYMSEAKFEINPEIVVAETVTVDESTTWSFGESPFTVTDDDGTTHPDTTYFPGDSTSYTITTTSMSSDNAEHFGGLTYTLSSTTSQYQSVSTVKFTDGYQSTGWQIKSGGTGSTSNRCFSFTPSVNGVVKVYARSGSNSNDSTLTLVQDETTSTLDLYTTGADSTNKNSSGQYTYLAAEVSANSEVKIYGTGNTAYYGIKFIAYDWGESETDSGKYTDSGSQDYGVIRFLQQFTGEEIEEYGFYFFDSDLETYKGELYDKTESTITSGFYGDIKEIDTSNTDVKYYAKPYVVIGGQIVWGSSFNGETVDFTRNVTIDE